MRKTVIDGSNTCGFQRTCVVALGGSIQTEEKEVPVQIICVEEDAARKMGAEELKTIYRLDRLGIPLIEVTTAPKISTPEEAEKVALSIGKILKRTGRVKRGIGSIRQDLNISIRDGALTEVKGVQELNLISKVVEYEIQRQLTLLKIKEEMQNREVTEQDLKEEFHELTDIFKETRCEIISKAIGIGGIVLAAKLQKMAGLLKIELEPNLRFGTELADRAKFYGDVGGLFHTDELPGYGITQEEVDQLRSRLGSQSLDAIILVADQPEKAEKALKAVVVRLREALIGIPEETRAARLDGTTRYMRPRPGAARMYPETDVPPITIPKDWLEKAGETLPPPPEQLVINLMRDFNVNRKLAEQLVDSDYLILFKKIVEETKLSPTFVAATLTETMKNLERKGIPIENLLDEQILGVFKVIDEGKAVKEVFPEIVEWIAKTGGQALDAIQNLGIKTLTRREIEELIEKRLKENVDYVKQSPKKAFDYLTKLIMAEVRGKADAGVVLEVLKETIDRVSR